MPYYMSLSQQAAGASDAVGAHPAFTMLDLVSECLIRRRDLPQQAPCKLLKGLEELQGPHKDLEGGGFFRVFFFALERGFFFG